MPIERQSDEDRKRKIKLPWLKYRYGHVAHYSVIIIVFMPLCLMAIGALAERGIYLPAQIPNYHIRMLPITGLIAVPLVLLRVLWKWPQHMAKLELFIYTLHSFGYVGVLQVSIIAGPKYYLANRAIREMFTKAPNGTDLINFSMDEDEVWGFLENAISTIYRSNEDRCLTSRALHGSRLRLMTSLKLRQHRVKQVCCNPHFSLFYSANDECTRMFSKTMESRAPYGPNATFKYRELSTIAVTGHVMDGDAYHIAGTFGTYPLSGFTTFFPPGVSRETALSQFQWMMDSSWIDFQTRAVVLELALLSPDFLSKPIWAAATFVFERDHIGRFAALEPTVYFNSMDFTSRTGDVAGGGAMGTCPAKMNIEGQEVTSLTPAEEVKATLAQVRPCLVQSPGFVVQVFYMGLVSQIIYLVAVGTILLFQDWRALLTKPFTVVRFATVLFLLTSFVMYMYAFRSVECAIHTEKQPYFHGVDKSSLEGVLSSLAPRKEFLPVATMLTEARLFLALAMFSHIISGLRFLVPLKYLGIMVRTLHYSIFSLLSFSISFFIIFFGFVVLFYYIYSLDVEGFQDLTSTVATLWLGMLGEIKFSAELYRAKYWTISLYILFTFISAFVLLTLIISIISNAHDQALEELVDMIETVDNSDSSSLQAMDQGSLDETIPEKRAFANLVSEVETIKSTVNWWKAVTQRSRRRVWPEPTGASSIISSNTTCPTPDSLSVIADTMELNDRRSSITSNWLRERGQIASQHGNKGNTMADVTE